MTPDHADSNPKRPFLGLSEGSRKRLRMMYHVAFALLLVHFALVYLRPGFFYKPPRSVSGISAAGFPGAGGVAHVIDGEDGTRLLPGGEDESMHFDVTTFRLEPANLKYGIGREAFPALIEPEFVSADEASEWLRSDERVLAVRIKDEVRVYPIDLLNAHEVVNDVVAGVPIFAAYCVLADLGAVYDRRLGDHTLTFALSGYTYADPNVWDGLDAFVLWDRETESLWWPPAGKAVSGPLVDRPLRLLDESHWSQTTWGQIAEKYPHAQVLERGQDFERPTDWPGLDPAPAESVAESTGEAAVAPRWGENASW